MNILQILPELVVGGVETGTVDLSSSLVKAGHRAIVVSNGGPMVERLEAIGAKHYKMPVHKKSLFSVIRCVKELKAILQKEEIQVVHARSRIPAIIAAFAVRSLAAKNVKSHLPVFITTCHGYYSAHIFSRPMSWGRFIIVSSNIIAMHMMEDFGAPFSRIKFIPRGVDIEKFKFMPPSERNSKNFTVGIIGRITPIKGHHFFIRAASKVARAFPGMKILVVGQPPLGKDNYVKQLKSLAERLGISESIEFLGHRQDIANILSKMDLLVLSSIGHEAFGRVVIEAEAAGVPVVATKVGGLTDIITDRKNGILVSPWNTEQLASAMIDVLKDRALAENLAQQARKDVEEKYTLRVMSDKTIAVYKQAVEEPRILVIKIGAVGDVVLVTPSLRALREKFPKARIEVLVGLESRQILQNCPYIDEVIVYNKPFLNKSFLNFVRLASQIRKTGFDAVIDFQNNRVSHLLGFFSAAPKRFGYRNKKLSFLLNHGIKDTKERLLPVEHQFKVLNLLGIELKNSRLEVWPSENDFKAVNDFLSQQWVIEGRKLVGINIGGSRRWQTKRWPRGLLVQLCDQLAAAGFHVVLTGSKGDAEWAGMTVGAAKLKPINAVGKTSLNELAALIKRCSVFISTDSAPMHIASATGTPLVAVFGPTDPDRHSPGDENITIITKKIKCSPCYKPKCSHYSCMKKIDVKEILEAIKKYESIVVNNAS